MEKVYYVYAEHTYDECTESFGMCTSLEEADKVVRDYIKEVWCFFCTRFYVEEWELNKRYANKLVKVYTKEDVIQIGKELGVYKEE